MRAKMRNATFNNTVVPNTIRPKVFMKEAIIAIAATESTFRTTYPSTYVSQNACHKRASPRQHRTRNNADAGREEGASSTCASGVSYGLIDIEQAIGQ